MFLQALHCPSCVEADKTEAGLLMSCIMYIKGHCGLLCTTVVGVTGEQETDMSESWLCLCVNELQHSETALCSGGICHEDPHCTLPGLVHDTLYSPINAHG